jgi:hypothetical protein
LHAEKLKVLRYRPEEHGRIIDYYKIHGGAGENSLHHAPKETE